MYDGSTIMLHKFTFCGGHPAEQNAICIGVSNNDNNDNHDTTNNDNDNDKNNNSTNDSKTNDNTNTNSSGNTNTCVYMSLCNTSVVPSPVLRGGRRVQLTEMLLLRMLERELFV